ncbi:DUF86 domain-containing protein [Synechococcus elongatus]|uniref:HepT-like ribonuclease domain-containing protein n=1 Tax=Synechococcus elongatus TaxID=32046 RepID=UPI000F7EF06F|nr:HepT-like ribonuclease domain-containing protein [Synechococcus elongatus]
MLDSEQLRDRLEAILEALERVPRRFSKIQVPQDFIATEEGREHLDSISMVLLSVGEAFRQIDDKTEGQYLSRYPEIPWRGVIGMRNVLAHDYFAVNEKIIFNTCQLSVPPLMATVRQMLADLLEARDL